MDMTTEEVIMAQLKEIKDSINVLNAKLEILVGGAFMKKPPKKEGDEN